MNRRHPPAPRTFQLVAAALVGVLAACASARGPAAEEPRASGQPVTTVHVENEEDFAMRIEIHTEVQDEILGQVSPLATATFRVPAGFPIQGRDVWLEAHPIGSTAVYRSARIHPYPGDRIHWELRGGPAVSASTITVESADG